MTKIQKNEKARRDFVRGIIAAAAKRGVSESGLKQNCFSSYATGNRRLRHHPEELTVGDQFNIALYIGIPPRLLVQEASENIEF